MTDVLKPCPHCGAKADLYEYEDAGMLDPHGGDSCGRFRAMDDSDVKEERESGYEGLYSVMCPNCPAMMSYDGTVDEMIAKWNRRANDA